MTTLTKSRGKMSFDDFCKKRNLLSKTCPKDPNFGCVCDWLKLLHIMGQCDREYFGKPYSSYKRVPNFEDDVSYIVKCLENMGVMDSPNKKSTIGDNTFWEHVMQKKTRSGNKKDQA